VERGGTNGVPPPADEEAATVGQRHPSSGVRRATRKWPCGVHRGMVTGSPPEEKPEAG
jgi:hypothetical protein